ncbi:hypothetical protein ABZ840_16285 [Streptomyces sp. NPDC047117]|uniref:hypothetical protein n=1 Tax=unclassified Streptomyces TaxID=2593676 RepID=UPI0033CECCD8
MERAEARRLRTAAEEAGRAAVGDTAVDIGVRAEPGGEAAVELRYDGRTVVVKHVHSLWRVTAGPAGPTALAALFPTVEEAIAAAVRLLRAKEEEAKEPRRAATGPRRTAIPPARRAPQPPVPRPGRGRNRSR